MPPDAIALDPAAIDAAAQAIQAIDPHIGLAGFLIAVAACIAAFLLASNSPAR